MPKPDLESAYSLKSADETRRFYADWADSYDTEFVAGNDYIQPRNLAACFAEAGGSGPVLDFGAGTGAMGVELARLGIGPVDALDLSPEMLAAAGRKGVYRDLIAGNILDGLDLPPDSYAGAVSAGTFTLGHVGPEGIPPLLRIMQPGGLVGLAINPTHYETEGFGAAFDRLSSEITDLSLTKIRYYGPRASGAHKDDVGFAALFRKR
ncbi:MAG: class I SAM-dependent methyltransferase [Rhodobacter sp.]|nr:class I SAM-dependent methyltransferase [Rhodobacter sp.]